MAEETHPETRILLEKAYEAVMDSGTNPKSLRGSNCAVFVATGRIDPPFRDSSEENTFYYTNKRSRNLQFFLANRISYMLDLRGPSMTVDSACASSSNALSIAYDGIKNGTFDCAIVGGVRIGLNRKSFAKAFGMDDPVRTLSFDIDGIGFAPADCVAAIFLQREDIAKRIYAEVVHAKAHSDGFKEEGIAFSSGKAKGELFKKTYEEAGIDTRLIQWVETHGAGNMVGDYNEITALSVFLEGRDTPLRISAVKTNMGHAEAASGMSNITKVIIAMENKVIPATLHYKTPKPNLLPLVDGRMEVITKNTPWDGGIVGINNYGMGGSNTHIILRSHSKEKLNQECASTSAIPRLVVVSGRVQQSIDNILDDLEGKPMDVEYLSLLNDVFCGDEEGVPNFFFRGYSIIRQIGNKTEICEKKTKHCYSEAHPLWYIFPGLGYGWQHGEYRAYLEIPQFRASIQKCHQALEEENIDLLSIYSQEKPNFKDFGIYLLILTSTQIAMVDFLASIGLSASGLIGHSHGEFAAAYADGCLTIREVMQMTMALTTGYKRYLRDNLGAGILAVVEASYEKLKAICPPAVFIVGHNDPQHYVISGLAKDVKPFLEELRRLKIRFLKLDNESPYHTPLVKPLWDFAAEKMKTANIQSKRRSSKWLSTCYPPDLWQTEAASTCNVDYYEVNGTGPVYFEQAARFIPSDAIIVEIGPCVFQNTFPAILGSNPTYYPLICETDSLRILMSTVGSLYLEGYNAKLKSIFPSVEYPVSRGTRMISPLLRWDHGHSWPVPTNQYVRSGIFELSYEINLNDFEYDYLTGHRVGGQIILPGASYLVFAWQTFATMKGEYYLESKGIRIKNVKFKSMAPLSESSPTTLTVSIVRNNDFFEVTINEKCLATGYIYEYEGQNCDDDDGVRTDTEDDITLTTDDVYRELSIRRYDYAGLFKSVKSQHLFGDYGKIEWPNNWVACIDNAIQISGLKKRSRNTFVVVSLGEISIDLTRHKEFMESIDSDEKIVPALVRFDGESASIHMPGVQMERVNYQSTQPKGAVEPHPALLKQTFVPFDGYQIEKLEDLYVILNAILSSGYPYRRCNVYEIVGHLETSDKEFLSDGLHNSALKFGYKPMPTIFCEESDPRIKNISDNNNVHTIHQKLPSINGYRVIITHGQISTSQFEKLIEEADNGTFFVNRESQSVEKPSIPSLNILATFHLKNENIFVFRKVIDNDEDIICFELDDNFEWVPLLQKAVKSSKKIVIHSNESKTGKGVLGLYRILTLEYENIDLRCFVILDENAAPFDLSNSFYMSQYKKNACVNVLQSDGRWGFYAYGEIEESSLRAMISVPHAELHRWSSVISTNSSRFRWMEGNLSQKIKEGDETVLQNKIFPYYSSMNYKDVLQVSGRTKSDPYDPYPKGYPVLREFSGRLSDGTRVMGKAEHGSTCTVLENIPSDDVIKVPQDWSLQEAATVPIVYGGVLRGLLECAHLKENESVLVISGTDDVGLAALNVCSYFNCDIFTTVDSQQKVDYIKSQFPNIASSQILLEDIGSLEKSIRKLTGGKGVNVVLNSMDGAKMVASVGCLSRFGRFVDIGEKEYFDDTKLDLRVFNNEISIYRVNWMNGSNFCLVKEGIQKGFVKPLPSVVFQVEDIDDAFRESTGEHVGKILIQLRKEEPLEICKPEPIYVGIPSGLFCNPKSSYIILGGLGGIGLELCYWLVQRGAMNLIIASRNGPRTGYQNRMVAIWKEVGVNVVITNFDISSLSGMREIFNLALKLGPVDGVFNLAFVLEWALFDEAEVDIFKRMNATKVLATRFLDELSREHCPTLRYFVAFSSIASYLGLPGQAAYATANAALERIVRIRRECGLPGLAIQLSFISHVGALEGRSSELSSVMRPQSVESVLEVIDKIIVLDYPVVVSVVIREHTEKDEVETVFSAICKVVGVKDLKMVNMKSTLGELGLDSLAAIELQIYLEETFGIEMTANEAQSMSLRQAKELDSSFVVDI